MTEKEALNERIDMAIETAEKFSELFYKKMDNDRHTIEKLYLPTASFTWNGNHIEGRLLHLVYLYITRNITITLNESLKPV